MIELPNLEGILEVPDAEAQANLARVPEVILAAAIQDARADVARKVVSNLSRTRREEVTAAGRASYPARTCEVARRMVMKVLLGIEDEETAGMLREEKGSREKELRAFLKKMAKRHPDFSKARQEWITRIVAGVVEDAAILSVHQSDGEALWYKGAK